MIRVIVESVHGDNSFWFGEKEEQSCNISINVNDSNADQTYFPNINILNLASCNLKTFPRFLINQSTLNTLDLSDNQVWPATVMSYVMAMNDDFGDSDDLGA
ncbi:receptor-like protein kinase, partial [Trifolium medium]|nr:receptor-like protein kinase [Trifolium medium]